ncbi:MAG: hypothetical protein ACREJD_01620 [Phycisphaerales bacterium]
MDYLTLTPPELHVRNARTGEVWAEIAPFAIADVGVREAAEKMLAGTGSGHVVRVVVRAGELPVDRTEDDIEHGFHAWSGRGKESLDDGMRALVEVCLARDAELLVWPRLGSLVSDIPGLLSVSRKHESVGIFLEPPAIFPKDEQFRLTDFVERLREVVPMSAVRAVCFGAAVGGESQQSDLAPYALLAQLAAELGKPVVIRGDSPAPVLAILELR